MKCLLAIASFFLLISTPMLASSSQKDSLDNSRLPCKVETNCGNLAPNLLTEKINACKIMVASSQCQSLGANVKLRDCNSEAFCPYTLDQSYILGCIAGASKATLDMLVGIAMTPLSIFEAIKNQAQYEAKYYSPSVYQACKAAEETVANSPLGKDLDCEKSFWHGACPRSLVRNCKDNLLEDFPDIKSSYGSNYYSIKYDEVFSDVQERLRHIREAQPSLTNFFRDNPNHPFQKLSEVVGESLKRQGYKFECLSSYDISHFSCDKIINAFALVTGAGAISKLRKSAEVTEVSGIIQPISHQNLKPVSTNLRESNSKKLEATTERDFAKIPSDFKDFFAAVAPDKEVLELIKEIQKRGISTEKIKEILRKAEKQCSTP